MERLPNGESFGHWEDTTKYLRILHVARNHPAASDGNDGSESKPFLTIQKAAALATACDTVLVHAGLYHETVRPMGTGASASAMLRFKGADGENVVVTGAEALAGPFRRSEGWKRGPALKKDNEFADSGAQVFMVKMPREAFVGVNPFAMVNGPLIPWYDGDVGAAFLAKEPAQRKLVAMKRGMVFCDGERLAQVANYFELGEAAGRFFVEDDGLTAHLRLPDDVGPDGHLLEYTAREQCFCPEEKYSAYIKIENLAFTKAGNGFPPPQRGAVSTNCGHHFIIDNCVVEDVNGMGIDIGFQCPARHSNAPRGHHVVSNCAVSRCGVCGLGGVPGQSDAEHYIDMQQYGIAVLGNRFLDNCWQDFEDLMENAAVKLHHLRDSLIAGNYVNKTTHGCGIWADAACENVAVRENVVLDTANDYGGIFLEASHEALEVSSNIVVGSTGHGGHGGNGIYSHNCDNILNVRNIVLDCEQFGIVHNYGGTGRLYRGRGNTGYGVEFHENLVANCKYALLQPTDKGAADRNVYGAFSEGGYLKVGLPELHLDFKAWRKYMGWDRNGLMADVEGALGPDGMALVLSVKAGAAHVRRRLDFALPLAAQIEGLLGEILQGAAMDDVSRFTLLPPGFLEQETCELRPLAPSALLPDGKEFLTWERPLTFSRTYHVAVNHPQAADGNPGTERLPWKTIGRAAASLTPGERVVIHGGVYRELVAPARGGAGPGAMISYEGAEGEKAVLRGSALVDGGWLRSGAHWRLAVPGAADNPFALANYSAAPWEGETEALSDEERNAQERSVVEKIPNTNLRQGLVFQDGRRLKQVASLAGLDMADGAYWVEPSGQAVRLRPFGDVDPAAAAFELTVRAQVFSPAAEGLGFIRVKNLTAEFTSGCIPWPQRGAMSARKGHHWIFEDNVIRDCNSLGLDVGHRQVPRNPRTFQLRLGGLGQIVRRNRVERCGVCGIVGLGLVRGMVEDNVCVDTGWLDVCGVCESAGIKIHYGHHTLVRGNLVLRTVDAPGIWIDHSNHNVRCCGNVVYGARVEDQDSWGGGIFFEASRYHNLVDHNVIWSCHTHGVYQHDCERLVVANNLVGECSSRPFAMRFSPSRVVHDLPGSGLHNRILGNVFYAPKRTPEFGNPENQSDANLFVEAPGQSSPLFDAWRGTSGQDRGSRLATASLDLDPETWTLRQSSPMELPETERPAAVTHDFFGVPYDGARIPCGPFALARQGESVNIRNPRWPLEG